MTEEDDDRTREEEAPAKKKERKIDASVWMNLGCFVLLVGLVGGVLVPNFRAARAQGSLTACKSNLKNIGTAMEMYSTDDKFPDGTRRGSYPPSLSHLTPNYLKTIPECPNGGDGYLGEFGPKAQYNTQGYRDYYFVQCSGNAHEVISVPAGYPQYSGIVGLIER